MSFTLTSLALTNASGDFVTVFPYGSPRPDTANLNPVPGAAVSNAVIVPPGNGGQVSVFNYAGSVNVVIDVSGYYTAGDTSTETFHPLPSPVRIYSGGQLGAGQVAKVNVEGVAGIPASGVAAAAVTVGAGNATAGSYLTVYADGAAQPNVANVSVSPGVNVTTLAQPQVGSDGAISVYNYAGSLNLFVDVEGYYSIDASNGSASYRPEAPQVLYDTRNSGNPLQAGETRSFNVIQPTQGLGESQVAPPNTTAVALNVTSVNATSGSYLEEYPAGQPAPNPATAILDPTPQAGAAPDALVLAKVGVGGQIELYNYAGSTDVVISLVGYYLDASTSNRPLPLNEQAGGALFDAPDPAAVQTSSTQSQIYATGTRNNTSDVFTEAWTTGTQGVAGATGALPPNPQWMQGQPGLPAYLKQQLEFAPSVAYIGGRYVMWFSGINQDGMPNCLESATSPTPAGPFTVVAAYCDPNRAGGYGDLDPSIFFDPNSYQWVLHYSKELATP
ncbi:MAG: hypothetical protein M3137_05310, partial [Actinomycetota bacterium]|nr:hypothetical protein [Actinomycetota bacterium]